MLSFREYVNISEETTSGDIATVQNKINLTRRPHNSVKCEKHDKENCEICKDKNLVKSIKEAEDVQSILRDSKIKIKDVIKTKFGTQYDLFVKPDEILLKKILTGYKYIIDSKSIFIYS